MTVGIDAIGVAVPDTYLELSELAAARNVPAEKYTEGLGTVRMGVPAVDEDTVTLAARAASHALETAGVAASEIGLCVVGTETAVDHSKPVASFVQGLLGLPRTCRVFETKHACYGGTAGLQNALDWIRAGSARGKKALVICADIARYGLRSAGEPTQGAGAVALLVSASPRLVSMDDAVGTHSSDVSDFWRPLYSKDAVVDGHYSVGCYLDAIEGAWRDYLAKAGAEGASRYSDRFAAMVYHVPYGKMARKAHRHLRTVDQDPEPDLSFERLVAAGLVAPSQIGNVYTGSLYLSLASTLTFSKEDLSGKQLSMFSYGSGSCADFFSGTVQDGAQERFRAAGLLSLLEQRRRLTLAEYEAVMNEREALDQKPLTCATRPGFRFLGVKDHRRMYSAG